ncbi:MAG: hypothetical protein ACM3ZR_09505 [Pseudomonadota bacterium]
MNKSIFAFFSFIVVIALISVISISLPLDIEASVSSETADEKKVVMVIADYLDIKDIGNMSFLKKLSSAGHMALMSNRQPGKASAIKSKLIIGSGKGLELTAGTAAGGSEISFLDQYRMYSGCELASGVLAYTDIFKLQQRNKNSEYVNYIGNLGEMTNANNGRTCVLGNADTDIENRSSLLVAMDGTGLVDSGETGAVVKDDRYFPFGIRTDYRKLAELYKQYLPASSFLVIDTGDMERLEALKPSMAEAAYAACRQATLNSIDGFMKELVNIGGFNTLIFISTYPGAVNVNNNDRLTPVLVYEGTGEGLLYSSNTRREGIILNTDMSGFIAQRLGYVKASEIKGISRKGSLEYLEAENSMIVAASNMRTPVLTAYAIFIIISAIVLFLIAVVKRKVKRFPLGAFGSVLCGMILIYPFIFLYMPLFYRGDRTVVYISLSAAIAAFASVVSKLMFKENIRRDIAICSIVFIGLALDVILGSPLIKQSVFGYDPEIGARFYGIGNEYAGVLIGSSLAASGGFLELRKQKSDKFILEVIYILCTLLLGLGFLGANFGGALAAASGYILAYFLANGIKFSRRNTIFAVVLLITTAILLITADYSMKDSQSHIGRLVKETGANGTGVVISTLRRKISMNLRLIRSTIWTKVLLSIIFILAFMFYKPVILLRRVFEKASCLKFCWMGIVASAVAGLLLNDSGIVIAATVMIYAAFTILDLCMEERNINEDEL